MTPRQETTIRRVNNDVYRRLGHAWWDDDVGEFSTIRFFMNPVRFGYFERVLGQEESLERGQRTLLDVGCGGGLLAEEFARVGFEVTGIDLAPESIETARAHASASRLSVEYETGSGEHLPFPDGAFDHVTCCDVLEHVDDVDLVIAEISRVLKPGGLFFYDTINRTFMSRLAVIKIMQEWPSTAFAEPNLHVWEKFIKPAELVGLLECHGLDQREMRGIAPASLNPIPLWLNFRRRAQGKITFKEFGRRLAFCETGHLDASYMGYAAKRLR
jgi:2-polyprenyl-6-hydroxyphenyl methylase / 3-demethylubiquinone-9 3-methyltransferase